LVSLNLIKITETTSTFVAPSWQLLLYLILLQ